MLIAMHWANETEQISHRPYSTGFYFGEPGQYTAESAYYSGAEVCAIVSEWKQGSPVLSQRNKFSNGDVLELITRNHEPVSFVAAELCDEDGRQINCVPHPMQRFSMRLPMEAEPLSLIRKKLI